MTHSPPREIHFFHIPKTAGSTLACLIRGAYPVEECVPAYSIRELIALPSQGIADYRCYTGHFFSLFEPVVGRAVPTVTLLRDPFEQTISLLKHCQRIDLKKWSADILCRSNVRQVYIAHALYARTLEQAWRHCPSWRTRIEARWCPALMNNFQTRTLGSEIIHPGTLKADYYGQTYPFLDPGFSAPIQDMDRLFDRAKARLKQMVVVGTVERMAESVALIFDHMGVPPPDHIPRVNVGHRSQPGWSYRNSGLIPPELVELIDQQNVYDQALYRYAETLLDQRGQQLNLQPNADS